MSGAIESQGFKFEIGNANSPLTYTEVKEIVSGSGPDGQASEIDVTHLGSTAKEFLMGLQDFGTVTLSANYLPDDPGQVLVRAAKASREIQKFKATFSDGTIMTFQGFVLGAATDWGVDAKMGTELTIRISGNVTYA